MSRMILFIALVGGLVISILLIGQKTNFFSRASVANTPSEIKISNLSDNSFTVSWITKEATTGFVTYGKTDELGETALDDRETGETNKRFTHHITLKNLEPQTTYYYKIHSGEGVYDKKGQSFSQETAIVTEDAPPLADPIIGTVKTAEGSMPEEALVYLQPASGTLLSSFTREDGNWLITLTNAHQVDLSNYLSFENNPELELSVHGGREGLASIKVPYQDKNNIQELVLQKSETEEISWPSDLNGDGVVNAFDFAKYLQSKAKI